MHDQPQPTAGKKPEHSAPAGPPKLTPSRRREGLRSALSTIAILIMAPLIALFLITFVFQSYLVDGPSMEKTLYNSDRLIVWKLPRTWARITGNDYIPNRGDVIVFTDPEIARFGQDPDKQLIKRVIGLPGERVVVKDGVVTVFNKDQPNGFQPDTTLPYNRKGTDTSGTIDMTVPKGQVYVMGDNRTNSLDSRSFGPVDTSDIVGKLVLRLLPLGEMKRF